MGEIQVLTLNPPKTRVSELTLGWNVAMNRPPKVEILTLSATMRAPQALTVRISPPSSFRLTARDCAAPGEIDSDADPETLQTEPISLIPGEARRIVDFGLITVDADR